MENNKNLNWFSLRSNERAQVWIETVLYLLIGLAIIGAVLAFVKPKINEIQDKVILDQSLDLLKQMDSDIDKIWNNGEGNQQIEEIELKNGKLIFNANSENEIWFVLEDSRIAYSEPGQSVKFGNIEVLTVKKGSGQDVYLKLKKEINLLYEGENSERTIGKAPTAYRISIQNNGEAINIKQV